MILGTPAYMSPEQCEGKGLIDQRSDVYSLGVLMYELITGRVPFQCPGLGDMLVAHITMKPDPPRSINADVTPELEAIVLHAIEKDRNRRFQTMTEFAEALSDPAAHLRALQSAPTQVPAVSPTEIASSSLPSPIAATVPGKLAAYGSVSARHRTRSAANHPFRGGLGIEGGPARKSRVPLLLGVAAVIVIAGDRGSARHPHCQGAAGRNP